MKYTIFVDIVRFKEYSKFKYIRVTSPFFTTNIDLILNYEGDNKCFEIWYEILFCKNHFQ